MSSYGGTASLAFAVDLQQNIYLTFSRANIFFCSIF
uniref:Uncharacterized protein n=1 Tax=Arundo donax TaxID=35708 RepID=A0A0A9C5S0_ARUDO